MEIFDLSVTELNKKLQSKELGFLETINAYIERIEKRDIKINSYISKTFESACEKAKELEKRLYSNEKLSNLAGVPFAVKDNLCVKDIKTTCASKILENFIPPYSATVVERLLEKDAILLGKLNMDEFAMGGSSETSFFKPVKNPHDNSKVPGGSSGGSAACMSDKLAAFTLGTDTGGSIRQPASFCGVVGSKPTYGRVSRYGLVAFASSLDQIGPLTRNVEDNALILENIAGHDKKDSTSSSKRTEKFVESLNVELKGMKFAYFKEFFTEGIDHEVKKVIFDAFETLKNLGAQIHEVSFELQEYAIPAYYIISSAEASSNLSRYDGIKYGYRTEEYSDLLDIYTRSRTQGFGTEVKRRIMLGTYALSSGYYDAYYLKALKVRNMIRGSMNKLFETYDAVIGPVAPTTAYNIGEKSSDPLEMYLGDVYTVSANIAGIPAISVPAGYDQNNLPVGLQISCSAFSEQKLLNIAYAYQNASDREKKIGI